MRYCQTLLAMCALGVLNASLWAGDIPKAGVRLKLEHGAWTDIEHEREGAGIWSGHAKWKETEGERQKIVACGFRVNGSDWQAITLKATPSESGVARLVITGDEPAGGGAPFVVLYDDIAVEGADLENGEFETMEGWRGEAEHALGEGLARTGEGCARVLGKAFSETRMNVEAGQRITVTVWVRLGE